MIEPMTTRRCESKRLVAGGRPTSRATDSGRIDSAVAPSHLASLAVSRGGIKHIEAPLCPARRTDRPGGELQPRANSLPFTQVPRTPRSKIRSKLIARAVHTRATALNLRGATQRAFCGGAHAASIAPNEYVQQIWLCGYPSHLTQCLSC